MERVTFQNKKLVSRIQERCVATWRNNVPGFDTCSLDDPDFQGAGGLIRESLAKSCPGTASTNVATIFSTPQGEVLHVAPGALTAELLLAELEFALSVDDAVRKAGEDAAARKKACAEKHAGRQKEL